MLGKEESRDPWKMYHTEIVSFIDAHYGNATLTWVEIGTAFGMTTGYVLSQLPHVVAHAIDPCEASYDLTDRTANSLNRYRRAGNMTHAEFSLAWAGALIARQQQQGRGCRYHHHLNRSTDAAGSFANGSIDVLFIDGLHTYDGVRADLEAYWPKLKHRSLLILNDWVPHWTCPCHDSVSDRHKTCGCAFPGVKKAACAFLATKGLERQIIEEGPVGMTNAAVVLGMKTRGLGVAASVNASTRACGV